MAWALKLFESETPTPEEEREERRKSPFFCPMCFGDKRRPNGEILPDGKCFWCDEIHWDY